jgi:hypothetical protein
MEFRGIAFLLNLREVLEGGERGRIRLLERRLPEN